MDSSPNSTTDYGRPVDYHQELMVIYVWPFLFVLICTILGTLGNLVVLYIYMFRWKKTKTRVFILNLALIDFINSSFNMPVETYILWHPLQFDKHVICKLTRGVTFVINNVGACIFVAIAIDRLLLLYKPFTRRMLTVKYAKQSCLAAFLIGIATGWPGFVLYGTATLPEKLGSVIVFGKTCYISDKFIAEKTWPFIFSIILFILTMIVFVILTISYILIGRKIYLLTQCDMDFSALKRARKKRLSSTVSLLPFMKTFAMGNDNDTFHGQMETADDETQKVDKPTSSDEGLNKRSSNIPDVMDEEEGKDSPNKFELTTSVSFGRDYDEHRTNNTTPNVTREGDSEVNAKVPRDNKKLELPRLCRRISGVNTTASRDNTLTMTMITIAFIVCFLPYLIIVTLRYNDEMFYFGLGVSSRIAYHVFLRMYFLNSVVNPFVYSFTNKQFRLTVLKLLKTLLDRGSIWKRNLTITTLLPCKL